jgi:hypothetical protein
MPVLMSCSLSIANAKLIIMYTLFTAQQRELSSISIAGSCCDRVRGAVLVVVSPLSSYDAAPPRDSM